MNPLFSLGNSQMALDSALLIIKMAAKTNAPTIPLDSVIDVNKLDPAKLTKIAMETGNKKLYDIAWNLKNVKPAAKPEPRLPVVVSPAKTNPNVVPIRKGKSTKSIQEILTYCDKYRNTSILGIGLVLQRAFEIKDKPKKERVITLQELTVYWVEELWKDKRVPRSHKFFRNFDCTGLQIKPILKNDDKTGRKRYTTGPLYVALRDAVEFCRREGIIKDEPGKGKFVCTIKGADLHGAWNKLDEWLLDRINNAS